MNTPQSSPKRPSVSGILFGVAVWSLLLATVFAGGCGKSGPSSPAPAPDATLEVPIKVSGALNLGSLEMGLMYDAERFELRSVKAGPMAQDALVESNQATPGWVRVGMVTASGISGDGAIVTLTFRPLGGSVSSSLTVEGVEATDIDLRDLTISVSPGQLATGQGQTTGPVLTFEQ